MDTWPDPRFRELTPQILESISADEVGSAIAQHVEFRTASLDDASREAAIRRLPPGTRAIYVTWLVDDEVNDAGFKQFFFAAANFAGLALASYELLGAEEYAAVMRAAIATHETERDTLARFFEIDQRYYTLGDRIYDAWAGFVRRKPELFTAS